LAFPAVTSTFRWTSAFLDCSGTSLTAVEESQPASGAMIDAAPNEITNPAVARILCRMICFSGAALESIEAQGERQLRSTAATS
jgi:hypothetical protein